MQWPWTRGRQQREQDEQDRQERLEKQRERVRKAKEHRADREEAMAHHRAVIFDRLWQTAEQVATRLDEVVPENCIPTEVDLRIYGRFSWAEGDL